MGRGSHDAGAQGYGDAGWGGTEHGRRRGSREEGGGNRNYPKPWQAPETAPSRNPQRARDAGSGAKAATDITGQFI